MIGIDTTFENTNLPITSILNGEKTKYVHDIYCLINQIVNVIFIRNNENWVLVDAGIPDSAEMIIEFAKENFGEETKPAAIILTHAHFDHVGSLSNILKIWDVPVYAHYLEIPYLSGKADYPEGDPTVDGGLISELSPLFPNHGINLDGKVNPLPTDGTIPELQGWRWIHTPGHTPGHISLFRDKDNSLIAGDAFLTVKQESLYKVVTQKQEISGPPKYFTTDWDAARESVKMLFQLAPAFAVTGHGVPMHGEILRQELKILVEDFDEIAIPKKGKFVN